MYTGTTIFSQVMRHLPWHHYELLLFLVEDFFAFDELF